MPDKFATPVETVYQVSVCKYCHLEIRKLMASALVNPLLIEETNWWHYGSGNRKCPKEFQKWEDLPYE